MPSPFPGMDPYLERPDHWPDVHHDLISAIRAELNQKLRPRYFARVEARVYLSHESDPGRSVIIPDVRVTAGHPHVGQETESDATDKSAVVDTIEPVEVTTLIDDEIHESRIEVINAGDRSVVCVIEILSPTNKVPGSSGRESYEEIRKQILRSPSHLVEIDLLRAGAPIYAKEILPSHDYLVAVSRARESRIHHTMAWPIPITKPLPVIPIPLRGSDPDAMIDLQQMLNGVYNRGAYEVDLNHTRDPVPPLGSNLLQWARDLFKARMVAG